MDDWVHSIKNNPASVDFDLRPISILFTGDQRDAVEAAVKSYLAHNILVVEARSQVVSYPPPAQPSGLPLVLLGNPITPDVPPARDFGFQMVVMSPTDSDGFEVELNKYYSIDLYEAQQQYGAVFSPMLQDLQAGGYTQPGYILILASFNWFWQAPPTEDFYSVLRAAGGGALLRSWIEGATAPGSISTQDSTYILVGATGTGNGTGAEALGKAPLLGGPISSTLKGAPGRTRYRVDRVA